MFEKNTIKLLNRWATAGPLGVQAALRLCRELVFFRPDPKQAEKLDRRKENPRDWTTSLEPSPPIADHEYSELLKLGIRPIAEAAPLQTATQLIEAAANMLVLDTGREPDAVAVARNDVSELWASRLDKQTRRYPEPKADLIRTLTFACQRVYERGDTTEIRELDKQLRAAKWYVFDRVRYHLYAHHSQLARQWTREEILNHRHYGDDQIGFEFQQMIRKATERFRTDLLSQQELQPIFEAIINAPDKEDYKRFMAEQFTEDGYRRRQEYFQFRQLRPFAAVLFGKYAGRYNALAEAYKPLSDEDYLRHGDGEVKTGVSRSPKTAAELLSLTDDELIAYLNDWEDAAIDPEKWWVETDFGGLATAFGEAIREKPSRFLAWGTRWAQIERPIYPREALHIAEKRIAENLSELPTWLELAEWIVSQQDKTPAGERPSEISRVKPNWSSARQQVVDFIGVCISKDVNVDVAWQSRIFHVLEQICVAPDYYLDSDTPTIKPRDYLTDAINTTRGRALENLLQYGFWTKRHVPDDNLIDLFSVLSFRFESTRPLSLAEHALLGASLYQLYNLNSSWLRQNIPLLFPQEQLEKWQAGFATYLKFNHAHPSVFELLKPNLEFAVEHISALRDEESTHRDPVASLGEHLLDYFLFGLMRLTQGDSLIARFYRKSGESDWAHLFDHLGRLLSKATNLKPDVEHRAKEFFEARLSASKAAELKEFTFWLRAECLAPRWRLEALQRILRVTNITEHLSMLVDDLVKMVKSEPDLVATCFRDLTEGLIGKSYFYLQPEHVKPILKAGLASDNPEAVHAAKIARDNLLKAGRSEYLNLDAIKDDANWL
jgi:hypothetical protein